MNKYIYLHLFFLSTMLEDQSSLYPVSRKGSRNVVQGEQSDVNPNVRILKVISFFKLSHLTLL